MKKKKEKINEKKLIENIKEKQRDLNQIKFDEFYYLYQKKKNYQSEIKNKNKIKINHIKNEKRLKKSRKTWIIK